MVPDISVIIPVYDDAKGLSVTLDSLRAMRTDLLFEILVCNDAGPASIDTIAKDYNAVHVRLSLNSGSYAARNAGIKNARADRLAFLDADQTVTHDWLERGFLALDHAPYVGGAVVVSGRRSADSWTRYEAFREFSSEVHLRRGVFPTANLFVLRSLIEAVGLFDERLRSNGDSEFGLRVRNSGYRFAFEPAAVSFHPPRGRAGLFRKMRRIACGRAQVHHLLKEKSFWSGIAVQTLKVTLSPLRFGYRVFARPSVLRELGFKDYVLFFLYDEILISWRAFWFIRYSFQIRSGSFKPYQDGAIGGVHRRS